jgi:TIR domain-containing protein
MPSGPNERYDFFLSRRGSVAAFAREVADVLTEKGYKVLVQDYDIPLGASFVEAMHEAVKNSRDLIILLTRDYEQSPYTRKEFTSFEAERAQSQEERATWRICDACVPRVPRCPRGLGRHCRRASHVAARPHSAGG